MIWTIVIGLIVGAVAKLLMPGKDPGGFIITILLGIAGATIARWIGQAVGMYRGEEPAGIVASILGAVLLLWIYRMIMKKRVHH
ncbi:GlsB/YeaQ/YmgE family stress response membrane protein [Bdellovibrio sp. HCB337]|uniref:GlsB/YeaQ/YmgE family stress response membrane protein n=1 Tax=Bdellovibrio sp. HCB337 TaxID=3394358 RepID=UPI0039A5B351